MEWISSVGGPLVVLPASAVPHWRGVAGGINRSSDYEIACCVDDYTGVISWRGKEVLVLDDEPHQTAVWKDPQGVILVRWMYAPEEATVVSHLSNIRSRLKDPVEAVDLRVDETDMALMDAAADGQYLSRALRFSVAPGSYRVATYTEKPTNELGLLIHTFTRND